MKFQVESSEERKISSSSGKEILSLFRAGTAAFVRITFSSYQRSFISSFSFTKNQKGQGYVHFELSMLEESITRRMGLIQESEVAFLVLSSQSLITF